MADQQPLKWSYHLADPEHQRTHPAHELLDALRGDQPVEIEAAVINGDLDLENLDYAHKLVIRNTVFTGHVDLSEGRFARTVDLTGCEFQRDLNFFGARIDGQLLLAEAKIRKAVQDQATENFGRLEVTGGLSASLLESEVGLCFTEAAIGASAEFEGVKIDGDLNLELARIGGHLSAKSRQGRRTEILGRLTLAGAAVGGEVRLDGAKVGWESYAKNRPDALSLASARVDGHVSFGSTDEHRTEILGTMSFYGASLGGDVCLGGVKIGREVDPAHTFPVPGKLNLRNVEISGNLFCQPSGSHRTEVLGTVTLFEAVVGGVVVLDGIKIGPEARSKYDQETAPGKLVLQDARIGGSLYCRAVDNARAEILGPVSLLRTTVGGSVAFQGAKIGREAQGLEEAPIPGRLDLSDARITGDVYCNSLGMETLGYSYRAEILGPVLLWGTTVGGDVFFDGVKIGREAQFPDVAAMPGELNLRDVDIVGDLFCSAVVSSTGEYSYRAEIHGPVSLVGAKVDGQVYFMGATIGSADATPEHAAGPVLNLQSAEITGGLYCGPQGRYFTEVHGDVRTFAANILCAVELDRARIHGDLDMERTVINGPLLCAFDQDRYVKNPNDASKQLPGHFQVDGKMKLTGAQAQDVVLDGRLFGAGSQLGGLAGLLARPIVFGVESLVFLLRLFTGQRDSGEQRARLRLDRARISKLQLQEAIPDRIHADGVTLADLELPGRPFEYTEFLKRTQPFRKSTYLSLEALLLNKGLDDQADRVYIAMANRDLILGRNILDRWFRWLLLGIPIGYGARSSRLFWFILLTFLLTAWIFTSPDSLVSYRPDDPSVATRLPSGEPGLETAISAALRYHFPMFHFIRENPYYAASTNPILELSELFRAPRLHVTYRMYALVISAVSWVVVPLWLAGLTGIVRRRR
ncbi:MAG: hypothetical protein A2V98_05315 [Planctomycetes bacterium RBG_16_64_12]|nr:MAG: hypothetical protein A2V98_05315 [Planctomycetes bacterium RBG_16_64_12]